MKLLCNKVITIFLSEYSLSESPAPYLPIFLEWIKNQLRLIRCKTHISHELYLKITKNFTETTKNICWIYFLFLILHSFLQAKAVGMNVVYCIFSPLPFPYVCVLVFSHVLLRYLLVRQNQKMHYLFRNT